MKCNVLTIVISAPLGKSKLQWKPELKPEKWKYTVTEDIVNHISNANDNSEYKQIIFPKCINCIVFHLFKTELIFQFFFLSHAVH